MIPGTDLHQFDVHNDGYFTHLPLNYVDGVMLEIVCSKDVALNLYLDHLDMDLSEYLSQAIIYDMDDLVSKKIGPPKKRPDSTGANSRTNSGPSVSIRTTTTSCIEDAKCKNPPKKVGKQGSSQNTALNLD
ncbi:hypothetical protein Tco_0364129 [Tanacetum coccineum]